jgi:anaerobic C4-dicarboxylate transporter DcuA
VVVLLFIWLGARLGSIGIGFARGFGVLVLGGIGVKPGAIPVDVILIIMGVIAAIAAMQVAGGLDYLVHIATKILKKNLKYITFLAPMVTYTITLFAGTVHTAFSTLPVIAEVAKLNGIRPSRPLSISTVASQIAIAASPISAAVVFFSKELEKYGVDYVKLLMITIPSSFLAVMLGAVVANFLGKDLKDDPVFQERLAKGQVNMKASSDGERCSLPEPSGPCSSSASAFSAWCFAPWPLVRPLLSSRHRFSPGMMRSSLSCSAPPPSFACFARSMPRTSSMRQRSSRG